MSKNDDLWENALPENDPKGKALALPGRTEYPSEEEVQEILGNYKPSKLRTNINCSAKE